VRSPCVSGPRSYSSDVVRETVARDRGGIKRFDSEVEVGGPQSLLDAAWRKASRSEATGRRLQGARIARRW